MGHIDIVGLGPGDPGLLTLKTLELLENKTPNYFRTCIHPTIDFINRRKIPYESFDQFYESADDFSQVYQKIVATLIETAKEEKIVYAVPGNPLFGEATVVQLIDEAKKMNLSYQIYAGVSFVDVTLNALEEDPVSGFNLCDAFSFPAFSLDLKKKNMITQLYNKHRASEVKLELMKVVDPEKEVVVVINAGIPQQEVIRNIPLFELDRLEEINHLTTLYLPPEKDPYVGLAGTLEIMRELRKKCPWDRVQDHQSLKPHLIEESYEVWQAIDSGDEENLCEELGDVFFQVVFHAVLAEEAGSFTMVDVLKAINEKMIRRHPHVFTKATGIDASEVETNWEAIKRNEKGLGKKFPLNEVSQQMKSIPRALPSLMKAQKIQAKAGQVGFDWDTPLAAAVKLEEEIKEVMEAIEEKDHQNIAEELGDLLFSVVNVGRLYDLSSEELLYQASQKFINRFEKMELLLSQEKKTIRECSFEELERLWHGSKKIIRAEKG